MNGSRNVWCTKLTQELQILNGNNGYGKTIRPGNKTGESLHYSKEQLLNIRRVMQEVRRFKIMPQETIRRVCKYRLNKRGKRSGKKNKSDKNQLIMVTSLKSRILVPPKHLIAET